RKFTRAEPFARRTIHLQPVAGLVIGLPADDVVVLPTTRVGNAVQRHWQEAVAAVQWGLQGQIRREQHVAGRMLTTVGLGTRWVRPDDGYLRVGANNVREFLQGGLHITVLMASPQGPTLRNHDGCAEALVC